MNTEKGMNGGPSSNGKHPASSVDTTATTMCDISKSSDSIYTIKLTDPIVPVKVEKKSEFGDPRDQCSAVPPSIHSDTRFLVISMAGSRLKFQSLDDLGGIKMRAPPRSPPKPSHSNLHVSGDFENFDVRNALPSGTIPVLAELVSTGLLVMIGCMACVHFAGSAAPSMLQIVLAFGFAVMFNIQIFGHVSGAHMNPAVTLASVLLRLTPPLLGVFYVCAQCVGAIAGYGLLFLLIPNSSQEFAPHGFCTTLLHPEITVFQGLMVEVAVSAVLIFVCCAFWDPVNHEKTDSLAVKFGLTITGLSLAGGPFTGASMNPARTLGPAVWNNMWTDHWIYWLGPLFSAVLASMLYKFIFQWRPQPQPSDPAEEFPLSSQEKSAGGAA